MFQRNIGKLDRIVRLHIAAAMVYLGYFDNPLIVDSLAQLVLGALGVTAFATALLQYCPLYTLVGIDTMSERDSS